MGISAANGRTTGISDVEGRIHPQNAIIGKNPSNKTTRAVIGARIRKNTARPSSNPTADAITSTPNIAGQSPLKPLPQWTIASNRADWTMQRPTSVMSFMPGESRRIASKVAFLGPAGPPARKAQTAREPPSQTAATAIAKIAEAACRPKTSRIRIASTGAWASRRMVQIPTG